MPLEYPEQSYFPNAKLRITLRLDEFGNPTRIKPPPDNTIKNLDGIGTPRTNLVIITDPGAPQGVTRYLISYPGATNVPAATNQSRSNDGLTFDVTTIPFEMDWSVNGIRTADQLSAKIKYIDCPVHPMVVRSIAVEAFMGTVTDLEYAQGIAGVKRQGYAAAGEGESLRVIQDTYLDANNKQRSNSRFQGWVDKWDIEWTSKDEPYIHLECRDNTQLLIDQAAPVNLNISAIAKPIDQAIATYLSYFPQFQGLTVEYRPNSDTPPTLVNALQGVAYRPKLGPQPGHAGGSSSKLSVWDYLTDVCGSLGHVIRVEGTNVIIQTARSITSSAALRRPDDPFQGRTLATGVSFDYRRFIYGKNLDSMKFGRTYTRNVPKNIEVRCWNTEQKELLVVRFPQLADRIKWVLPGNAQTDTRWEVIRVSGIRDKNTLLQIAQTAYEQLGRNEMTVELKTKNLASFGAGNTDPDILDMKAGDTFEVLVAKRDTDEVNTLGAIESLLLSQQKNAAFMKQLGFSADFANAYAQAYTDAGYLTLYRLRTMKVHWTITTGIDITVTGINYIEVRADKSLPAGQEPGTTVSANPPNKPQNVNVPTPNNVPSPSFFSPAQQAALSGLGLTGSSSANSAAATNTFLNQSTTALKGK